MDTAALIDYQSIFMQAPIGMCVSHRRIIQACNQALARMFGYAPDALVGQSFSLLYPSTEEFERTGARIAPIMNAKGHYSDERIMKRMNQELFWCHVSGCALVRGDPHAAGIWTFEDLRARRPVTAELHRAKLMRKFSAATSSELVNRLLGVTLQLSVDPNDSSPSPAIQEQMNRA